MTKSGMNLQDSFLNQVRKENTEIMLVLLDGTRLTGHVRGFDNFTVIMNVRGSQHMIYKHAIAQIVSRRMTHTEGEGPEGGQTQQEGGETGAPAEGAPAAGVQEEPRQGGSPEGRREGQNRDRDRDRFRDRNRNRDNRERNENDSAKPKFNTIDLSSIKFEESKE